VASARRKKRVCSRRSLVGNIYAALWYMNSSRPSRSLNMHLENGERVLEKSQIDRLGRWRIRDPGQHACNEHLWPPRPANGSVLFVTGCITLQA
jgi:hypothetical protein